MLASLNAEAIFSGIGAIVTAAGGVMLVLKEMRRRDRVALNDEIKELSEEVHELRHSFQEWRRFTFELRMMMVDNGLEPPEPPVPSMATLRRTDGG